MPLKKKNLPIPKRNRSVGERIVQVLELAALARTISKVLGRRKSSRVPAKGGLLAVVAAGLLAVVLGIVFAKRKAGDSEPAPPQSVAPPAPAKPEPAKPDPAPATPEPAAADSEPVKAAVAAAEKLNDIDGTTDGEAGEPPADGETAS